ncbi:hypothetical protein EDD11_001919 [Mortierella claussenii]|nr:hypothetical protein EDD11_001919 [Mortierella claussenii]
MGGLFSKSSKTQKSRDPKWQGIGPNTPLPNSSSSTNTTTTPFNNQTRSQTLSSLDNRPNNATSNNKNASTKSAAAKQKSSKVMLLLKMDPKSGGKQRKIITKNLISLPSDFRHTGHIGAGEVRSGQINTDKIKNQMMEVAACLKLDMNTPMPMLKTMPIQDNRENIYNGFH